jgi:hypothetical protein
MAYYIFLKSLRSLEEFRKNPQVKIPPKSPCANFQSLGILKKSNFIRKRIFPVTFGPAAAHFLFFSTGHFSPSPLGLGLSAGPAHLTAQRPSSSSSSPRRLSAAFWLAPLPHPRRQDPLLRCKTPAPSTIKPQPLPSLNRSFTAIKSPSRRHPFLPRCRPLLLSDTLPEPL